MGNRSTSTSRRTVNILKHPYEDQPPQAFWSRSVASNFDPADVVESSAHLVQTDRVLTAGSCFASNLVPWLRSSGIEYLSAEQSNPAFSHLPNYLGYDSFSAAYGNIYTARHLLQLLQRALGTFHPIEDRWHIDGLVIDPFRPGLRHPASSDREFDLLTEQHLTAVKQVFEDATVVVFTLGLTEAWESKADGAVFPVCPGTVAGQFDEERHQFHNFTVDDVRQDLIQIFELVRSINPQVRFILTVSPVPLVATATNKHVLVATTYSKAVLRAAAAVCDDYDFTSYFPAFEIVSGPQAPADYYAENKREVTDPAIEAVMSALFSDVVRLPENHVNSDDQSSVELSSLLAKAECDEVMVEGRS